MITQQTNTKPIPKRSSLVILGAMFLSIAIVMACTDMQPHNVFDEEELNLMTDMDLTGEHGYHQIIIFLDNEEEASHHENNIRQLEDFEDIIKSIELLDGEAAIARFGERAEKGVLIVKTDITPDSFNSTLKSLGMEPQNPPPPPEPDTPYNALGMDVQAPPPPPEPGAETDDFYVVVEEMPELIGGLSAIMQEIRYPREARDAGIEGRVTIQFVVNEEGNVEDPQIIRGVANVLDKEALRVIKQAKFKPGYQRGKPVRVQYSLPVFFRLQGNESTS